MTERTHQALTDAMQAHIESNDLVIQVARMIDPGAFQSWCRSTAEGAEPVQPDAMKRYKQAHAILVATDILKLASTMEPGELRKALAKSEKDGWRHLLPENFHGFIDGMVDDKFGLAHDGASARGDLGFAVGGTELKESEMIDFRTVTNPDGHPPLVLCGPTGQAKHVTPPRHEWRGFLSTAI
jgi:hypothetical protein